jgi:hypothetical protein
MTMKSFAMLAAVGALGVFSTGCSDPCGDLKACCVAQQEAVEGGNAALCDLYDEADSDACQALIDAFEVPEGAEVPAECQF